MAALVFGIAAPLVAPLAARAQSGIVTHDGRRFDQRTFLGTHNSYANQPEGFYLPNQWEKSTVDQLNDGVRYINPDVWLVQQTNKDRFALPGIVYPWTALVHASDGSTPVVGYLGTSIDWTQVQPKQLVVAHNITGSFSGYSLMKLDTPYQTFRSWLSNVVGWVRNHEAVIVVDPEDQTFTSAETTDLFRADWTAAGADPFTFYPDRENARLPAPLGRPGGWDIRKYGYPTEAQMLSAGYRIILIPTPLQDSTQRAGWFQEFIAKTVYGGASIDPDTWYKAREGTGSLRAFNSNLFLMEHARDIPQLQYASGDNAYTTLTRQASDIFANAGRIPNFFGVDFYQYGTPAGGSGEYGGAFDAVRALDAKWSQYPVNTPILTLSRQPNGKGWLNQDVDAQMGNAGDASDLIVWSVFGAQEVPYHQEAVAAQALRYAFTREGLSTLSFSAVSPTGNRSDQRIQDIKIDKTAPGVSLQASPVIINGASANTAFVVTIKGYLEDTLSKLDWSTAKVTVTDEYGERSGTFSLEPRGDGLDGEAYSLGVTLDRRVNRGDKDGRRYTITAQVSDNAGNTTTSQSAPVVAQYNNAAPIARAGDDQTVSVVHDGDPATRVAEFTLDGNGSADPDGDTPVTYAWKEGDSVLGTTPTLKMARPAGTYTVTLSVSDPDGAVGTDTVVVTVGPESNAAPTANAGGSRNIEATGPSTSVTLAGSGTDRDGDHLTYEWKDGSGTVVGNTATLSQSLGLGASTFTLTVRDPYGATATDSATVTLQDTTRPAITLNGYDPMTIEAGAAFTDPGATARDTVDGTVAVTSSGSVDTRVPGTYLRTYTAKDRSGNTATRTRTVIVQDTIAPTVTAQTDRTSLWPPNGKNVSVTVTGSVSDSGSGVAAASGAYTVQDSQGTTIPGGAFTINADGTYAFTLNLTASRNGSNPAGRTYTILVSARDNAGNPGTATVTVIVPHYRGG